MNANVDILLKQIEQQIIETLNVRHGVVQFNTWFELPGFASLYVRSVCRYIPKELFIKLSALDLRQHQEKSYSVQIQTLELSNFTVNKVVRRQGVATKFIAGLSVLANEHGLYFMIENVVNPHLQTHLFKQREVFVPRENGLGVCFYRRYGT